ncbi:monovalent cation/H(+) antiporter subunit G [Kocuria coralli]|uniref:Monovalent cation/H(+) antiporter subunit G n=1 Tax=Kocuria coralli TaxID=1461025 RepID=A0A5J5KU50_9MICC|nr:monovalent cation/H(+) antiporter subunit G [Kocuria coralli]KAA9392888.1 monovalent cation/H(+) antiporter subunit G [Kocuria coralli]
MSTAITVFGDITIVAGALVFATAALGLVRFPDVYTRISAVGTAAGIGIVLVVVGALLHQPTVPDALKVIVIIVLQLITSAVGSIAIARSAYLMDSHIDQFAFDDLQTHETLDPEEAPRS